MTVEAIFRREYGRCVATLIRFIGDINVAEEAVQDAFTVAADRWPSDGEPPNPGNELRSPGRPLRPAPHSVSIL